MSYHTATEPLCLGSTGPVALVIEGKQKDLGGLVVRRVLPARDRRMVGPFIFFDHMGPADFPAGQGIQVRPHPHIGLATVTYLFDGEILHRDSLGFIQPIRPGAVNLMTAGRGIVHSERAPEGREAPYTLHGIQSWTALPTGKEECAPAFVHYPAEVLPESARDGVHVRVIMGSFGTDASPVTTHSPSLYLDCTLEVDATLKVPAAAELAVYVVGGKIGVDGKAYSEGTMLVARAGQSLGFEAIEKSRVMVIGGDPVGARHIWWNFVSSSRERIETAKADWLGERFPTVPGETEFIPLPE